MADLQLPQPGLSRRSILAAGAGAGAWLAGTKLKAHGAIATTNLNPRALDLSRPADNVYAIVKIQGDTSGRPTVSWGYGHIFGIRDGEMARPLLQFQSCRIGVYLRQPDDSYRFLYRGLITYHDYESGQIIDRFRNPYTGREVEVKHWKSSIGELTYTTLGIKPARAFTGTSGKAYGEPYVLPWKRTGNTIWTMLDERVRYLRPSDKEWRRDNAILRYESKWDELTDPNRTSASALSSFQTHIDWFSWFGMEDNSGGLMQGGVGRKFLSVADLPPDFLVMANERYPGFLDDPFPTGALS